VKYRRKQKACRKDLDMVLESYVNKNMNCVSVNCCHLSNSIFASTDVEVVDHKYLSDFSCWRDKYVVYHVAIAFSI